MKQMRDIAQFVYGCFYYMTFGKNFRHFRAAFGASLAITLYLSAVLVFTSLYLKLYLIMSALIFSVALFSFIVLCSFFLDKHFSKRAFYVGAIARFDNKSRVFKRVCGLVGGLLFFGSSGALLYSFLAFAHKT